MGLPVAEWEGRYDVLIVNAVVVDGTGAPGRPACVAVRDDTIVAVGSAHGDLPTDCASRVIDGTGLILAPGFIDMHTHSDRTLLVDPSAQSNVRQGVTTEVIGNCGNSPAPCFGAVVDEERYWFGRQGVDITWRTMGEYLDTLADRGVGINVAALVGHGAVRKVTMGYARRAPDAAELKEIRRHVAESMSSGAFGMSFGGAYAPSYYAATEELIEASKEVAKAGGIYATHMRHEGTRMLESVEESIRIGRESGASVQISHHEAVGPSAWGLVTQSLKRMEAANREGVAVTVDQTPYVSGAVGLKWFVPAWAHEGGPEALLARLRDPLDRARIRAQLALPVPSNDGSEPSTGDIVIAFGRHDHSLEGEMLREIAATHRVDPRDVVLDVLIANDGFVTVNVFAMSEDDVRYVMRHPLMMVGSDGTSIVIGGPTADRKPHPRTYGTFARILGQYVRDEGVLPLRRRGAATGGGGRQDDRPLRREAGPR